MGRMNAPPIERIPLPVVAAERARPGAPLVATVAPLALAVALWLATGSPYALLVGLLAPIVAVGSMLDARRLARRERRRAVAEARDGLARAGDDARARRDARAAELRRAAPEAAELVLDPGRTGWRLGTGDVRSGVELTGDGPPELAEEIAALREAVGCIRDAPIVVSGTGEFAVTGVGPLVRAFCRGLVLQAVARCELGAARVETPPGETWTRALPAATAEGDGWRVESADRTVLRVDRIPVPGATVVRFPDDGSAPRLDEAPSGWRPALLAAAEAEAAATRLAEAARALGRPGSHGLPCELDLAAILDVTADSPSSAATIGLDADGPVLVDLERDGPHALVAGTTGSGKSELLVTWVLALAARRPPGEVSFLLVDFKGGAAFAPLEALPHVVGVVSDLDEATAARAVRSLRAELRRREAVLARHGARDIAELPTGELPRLVIVVDEFAALLDADEGLHRLFADLAARGRSLGMHLLLGTQRPTGVVRDALLANVTVRVCLRVLDPAESAATVGIPDAAAIDARHRGRAVIADPAGRRALQVARADAATIARVVERWRGAPVPAARPWVDPLPARVGLAELPPGAVGLVDLPDRQRRDPLVVDAWTGGAVLVLGAASSGRTTALAALAAAADAEVRWTAGDAAELWQALVAPCSGRVLVLADDLDAALAQGDPEQRADLAELVARAARGGARSGLALVASARTAGATLLSSAGAFEQRVLLRLASREDHLLAGGDSAGYLPHRRPGSALWRGHEAQFALAAPPTPWRARIAEAEPRAGWGVVTPRPGGWAARLEAQGLRVALPDVPVADSRAVLVGDPETWLASPAALSQLRRDGCLLFHGCARADHRLLTRGRAALPPLAGDHEAWLVEAGETRRVRVSRAPEEAS